VAEYLTTALAMPFEVGKTLLQIEYRPRKRFAPVEEEKVEERDWEADKEGVVGGCGLQLCLHCSSPAE
jgi:hypothetical protein